MIKAQISDSGKILITEKAVSDSVKFETVKFIFPEKWENYTKTAVFSYGEEPPVNIVLDKDNPLCISEDECYIPFEVLKTPAFSLSVFGIKGDSTATATACEITVIQSGYALGDEPMEPTESQYSQLINLTAQTKEIALSVRNDADNGLFKGDKGDKGDQGAKGDQGEKGEKGDRGNAGPVGPKGSKGDKGDQGEKGEKGDKGDKGEDAVIDQAYSPKSVNAQSGIAVAQALENKPSLHTGNIFEISGNFATTFITQKGYLPYRVGDFYFNSEKGQLFIFISVKQAESSAGFSSANVELLSNSLLSESIKEKIEIWQSNTQYSVGDLVIAKVRDEDFGLITKALRCKERHISANATDIPQADMYYWSSEITFSSAESYYSQKTVRDDNGNIIHETYATKEELGDISIALEELHTYAQAIINGGVTE